MLSWCRRRAARDVHADVRTPFLLAGCTTGADKKTHPSNSFRSKLLHVNVGLNALDDGILDVVLVKSDQALQEPGRISQQALGCIPVVGNLLAHLGWVIHHLGLLIKHDAACLLQQESDMNLYSENHAYARDNGDVNEPQLEQMTTGPMAANPLQMIHLSFELTVHAKSKDPLHGLASSIPGCFGCGLTAKQSQQSKTEHHVTDRVFATKERQSICISICPTFSTFIYAADICICVFSYIQAKVKVSY